MRIAFAFLLLLAHGINHAAFAQDYPTKPVRMIVPFPAGGGVDMTARVIGARITEALGQQVIVDNRGGAAGSIGMELAAGSKPDGYTLITSSAGPLAINPGLYASVPYDSIKNFSPVALVATEDYALTVHPSVPARSVNEFIALAKAQPGKVVYGSSAVGGVPHLAAELLQSMAGIKMLHVPYKGGGPAIAGVLGGEVNMYFPPYLVAAPHVSAGKLRVLAVASGRRAYIAPDLPTIAESGLPGYEAQGWTGVLAPAGTPQAIIAKLNAEIVRVLPLPEVSKLLGGNGSEFGKNTPEQFGDFLRAELDKWRTLIKALGVKVEH